MDYEQSLEYLNSLIKFGIKFGLERIYELADRFGNPQERLKVVHVGGTNGKGSTCAFISSILASSGYKVGTYLSPYVNDPRERIQINGAMIGKAEFAELISQIAPEADKISASELGPVTEFEAKTMAALLHFDRMQVDVAVMEVGMGGRFDATNIVRPMTSVITNVTLDHMERLGNTVAAIAGEKAGIIKPGAVVVTSAGDPDALNVISEKCRHEGAQLWRVREPADAAEPEGDVTVLYKTTEKGLEVSSSDWAISGLTPGLRGDFQAANAAAAVAAVISLESFGFSVTAQALFEGVEQAYIPGRMEIIRHRPLLLADGAHNPDAAQTLARNLAKMFEYKRLIMVIGMLNSHDLEGVVAPLSSMADMVIATKSNWFKARDPREISECAEKYCKQVEIVATVPEAVERALQAASEEDMVVVTGSFYTVGEVPRDSGRS